MANWKKVDADQLDADLTSVADAIRERAGISGKLDFPSEYKSAVEGIPSGRGEEAPMKDVNFYDYDGFRLYSYTLAEAQVLTELPQGVEHKGLVFQGWNWTLSGIKSFNRFVEIGAHYTTDDGSTRLYVELSDGCTSPQLGLVPNGTIEIDWGDGTEKDIITGTATSQTYANTQFVAHNYATPGSYKITIKSLNGTFRPGLLSDGKGGLFYPSDGNSARPYRSCVKRVECGDNLVSIDTYMFYLMRGLKYITIPNTIASFLQNAFHSTYGLDFVVIPKQSAVVGSCFLENGVHLVVLPESVKNNYLGVYAFHNSPNLLRLVIPEGVSTIPANFLTLAYGITEIVIPSTVKRIDESAFNENTNMKVYDFSRCTSVPVLAKTNAFNNMPSYCEIRVHSSLYDEWIAATNWSTYANQIVGV